MAKRILLIGACGYVGDYLCDLIDNTIFDYEVMVYDALYFTPFYLRKNINFIRGDIRDKNKLKPLLDSSDVVVLLAGFVGDGACSVDGAATLDVNRECVKWISENFSGRLYFTSTCSVYGAADELLTEESPTNPLSLYASSKLQSEQYLLDKNALIVRLGTLYGLASQWVRPRLDLVANRMVTDAFYKKQMRCNSGTQWRPMLHVRDIAKVIARDIRSNGKETGIFNLASENTTLLDIAKRVQKFIPEADIIETELPTEDRRNYKVSWEKARKKLNFYPFLTLEDGIKEFVGMLSEGRIKDPTDPIYHNHQYFKQFKPFVDSRFPAPENLEKELAGKVISSVV